MQHQISRRITPLSYRIENNLTSPVLIDEQEQDVVLDHLISLPSIAAVLKQSAAGKVLQAKLVGQMAYLKQPKQNNIRHNFITSILTKPNSVRS